MDILETKAKNMIRDYLNILACKFIDDETTYMKHVQKQAALNNEEAMHKLSVCKHFEQKHEQIHTYIDEFRTMGYQRIADVCSAIRAQPTLPFTTSMHWTVCGLSGVNTNNAIRLLWHDNVIYLDCFYASFAAMFWMVTHVVELEFNRLSEFLSTRDESLSISQCLAMYQNDKDMINDDLVHMYFTAYDIVFTVMAKTRAEIESQVIRKPVVENGSETMG